MAATEKYKGSYTPFNIKTGWVEAYGEWYINNVLKVTRIINVLAMGKKYNKIKSAKKASYTHYGVWSKKNDQLLTEKSHHGVTSLALMNYLGFFQRIIDFILVFIETTLK